MSQSDELFPRSTGFRPDRSLTEPRIWVKEMRVYRVLAPGESNILRRIELHAGLNILWARPRDRSEPARLHAKGVSGHGTGKTTFCRFIRHLLGEPAFGTDEQRSRLRHTFPEGWLVGEVRVDSTPWLICLPFKVGTNLVAYRNRGIASLFDGDEGRVSFEDYRKELDRLLAEPLPVATFATSPTPIDWPHIVQWLTRDQECRFAGLGDLRHTTSDSKSPEMSAEDRHFLFRAVLGLIDPTEQGEIEKNKRLLKQRHQAERDAPLLRFRGDSALNRLREDLPEFRQDLAGAEFLNAVAVEWKRRQKDAELRLQSVEEPESLLNARKGLLDSERHLRRAQEQEGEISETLEWIEQQIKNLSGELSDAALDEWVRSKMSPDRFCGHTLAEAIEWECPLASGRKLRIEKPKTDLPTEITLQQLNTKKEAELKRLAAVREVVSKRAADVEKARNNFDAETTVHAKGRGELAREAASAGAVAEEAERAKKDKEEADRLDGRLSELERQIRNSQDLQATIRDKSNSALSAFSETFGRVSRAVVGDDITAEIRFRGRQIRPAFTDEIDLTSAALETLKIICFDLAGLVSGVEGRGFHPRFLIHDGPREADMDVGLYQRIFLLIKELEDEYGEAPLAFQYIITTTEPPPEDLQSERWLLHPVLDASRQGGKLLGENF